jgi:AbrB family looped-hinge helix DNA binding protein
MGVTATLSAKFQISIPKEVREQQGWKPGQKFAFVPSGGGFRLVPVPKRSELLGLLRDADPSDYRDRNDRY